MVAVCAVASSCMTNGGHSDHGAGTTAGATVAYIGEPLNTAPVSGLLWYHDKTPAEVTSLLNGTNRLVSIQVAQASPLKLTVTMVPNTGTYQKTWYWFTDLTPEKLQLVIQTLRARPVSMDAYVSNGVTLFAVVMVSNAGTEFQGWHWYNGGSVADLTTAAQGSRLIDLRRTGTGSGTQYTALIVANNGPDATQSWWYLGQTVPQILANLAANDAYLVSLSPADTTGATYDVVMNKSVGVGWTWYFDISESQVNGFLSQNQMRPVDVKSVTVNGQRFYTVIMVQNTWSAAQQANAACDATVTSGWLANPVATGLGTPSTTDPIDNVFSSLMKNNAITGGSVSVTKDGNLVLTRAYGFANKEQLEIAHPDSIFRVASVSKVVTGMAILLLIDQNKIHPDDAVFPILGLAANPPNVNDHTNLNTMTVFDLLHHMGGFDPNTGCSNCATIGDPVTANPSPVVKDQKLATGVCTNVGGTITCGQPPNCTQEIQWVISHPDLPGSLAFLPGAVADYSNLGYCILGALIEKVTGTDYGTWVTNNILNPSGARDFHVGQTLGVQDREVSYYEAGTTTSVFDPKNLVGQLPGPYGGNVQVPRPYGSYFVEGSPASGGWAASTIDWLRFQVAIDGRRAPAFLSSARVDDIKAYPGSNPDYIPYVGGVTDGGLVPDISGDKLGPKYFYGPGWDIHHDAGFPAFAGDWSVGGSIAGTNTIAIHMANGFGIAGFVNDSTNSYDLFGTLYQAFSAAQGVDGSWFSGDLFDQYASYTGWMTGSQYQTYFNQQVLTGLYPTRIEGINHVGTPMFRAAFAPFKGYAWESHHGFGCTDYQAINSSLAAKGYKQTSLQSYVDTDGTRRYQATWVDWSACSPSCTSGSPCTGNADCQSGICTNGTCAPPLCAPTCGVGTNCGSNADCASGLCKAGICAVPTCSPSCATGQPCTAPSDCASSVCTAGKCAPPACATAPSKCNQNNPCGSDSDCGSNVCVHGLCAPPACSPSCGNGSLCNNNSNCASFVCGTNFTCKSPPCATQAGKCPTQSPCGVGSDCGSGICMSGLCQAPACSPNCGNGIACSDNGNCGSKICRNAVCVAQACAPNCGTGLPCGSNNDCHSPHICKSNSTCQ